MNDQRTGEEHALTRYVDGRAGRGRNLVERQEVDGDRGITDRRPDRRSACRLDGLDERRVPSSRECGSRARSKRAMIPFFDQGSKDGIITILDMGQRQCPDGLAGGRGDHGQVLRHGHSAGQVDEQRLLAPARPSRS